MGREGGASIAMERDKTTLNVRHVTTYDYARPVEFGEHRIMMRPRDRHDQRLVSSELVIDPRPARLRWLYDAFDNCVAMASFSGASASLRVESRFTVERTQDDQPGGEIDPRARLYPFAYAAEELPDIARSMERLYPDPAGDLDRWARQFVGPGETTQTSHLLMTHDLRDQGGVFLRAARGGRRAAAAPHPRPSARQLPRFRGADDGGAARARHRGSIRLRLHLRSPGREGRARGSAAGRPTPGARSICRAPAGSNSTRPTG